MLLRHCGIVSSGVHVGRGTAGSRGRAPGGRSGSSQHIMDICLPKHAQFCVFSYTVHEPLVKHEKQIGCSACFLLSY